MVADCKATITDPFVRRLESFGTLPESDKLALARLGADAHLVEANTTLISEGDAPNGVILVLRGFACRFKMRANGERQIMAYLVAGDFCDLDVALLPRMDHAISTLSASHIVRIAPHTIQELLQRPVLARALRMATLVEAAVAREWIVNVGRRSAVERIAHLFCELLSRLKAIGMAQENSFCLPLTQTVLADTTGLSLVHMNKSLRSLKDAGLVEMRQRHLRILDLQRLSQLGDYRSNYLHLGDHVAA